MSVLTRIAACFLIGLAARNHAFAELPSPRFDRLTPLGGSPGSTVEVAVLGADIEGVETLYFDHAGLSAEFVAEKKFKVSIGPNVPDGTYDVRLTGRFGISNPRLFAVSRGLQEVSETEPNNSTAEAQTVSVNSVVNGTSDGNGEDMFRIELQAGQRIVIDCLARRLESELDASIEVSNAAGRLLSSNGDWYGADPFVDFVSPEDGAFLIRINDLRFRGGYPYRLMISDRPHIEAVHPRAIQAGQTAELVISGRGLAGSSQPDSLSNDGPTLRTSRVSVSAPTDALTRGTFSFLEHPTGHSVLPTAATCTLNGFQIRPWDECLNALPMLVSSSSVTLEAENNDDSEKPQSVSIPAVISGRFDRPRDGDWFEFEVPEGGQYGFDVYSERINGRADPFLVVMDDKGGRVSELDDFGHRINAFDGHLRDPSGMLNLGANRKYRVLVQDRYGRGGARYQYVLTIRRQQSDWFAAAIHSQNPGPGGATIWKGTSTSVDLVIHRQDGFNGPITVTAEGLPEGVSALPTVIHNDTRGTFVLTAAENAPDWTGEISLVSQAEIEGEVITREVRPYSRCWNNAGFNSSRPTRKLGLAVREKGPFALMLDPAEVTVEAGKSVDVAIRARRLWDGFDGRISIIPSALPGGFSMGNSEVAASADDGKVTFQVQAGRLPGKYTMTVLGQAQVPFSKDATAENRPNTLVTLPATSVTLNVTEPAK